MCSNINCMVVLDEVINDLLISIIRENGISEYNVTKIQNTEKGTGYSGTITTIDVVGKTVNNEIQNLYLVFKSVLKYDQPKYQLNMQSVYAREIYAYREIFPKFYAFEEEIGQHFLSFTTKFYGAHSNETLILENLTASGYSLYNRNIPMDEKHVRLVLEQYGRLHALSFGIRDQKPREFNKLTSCVDDVFHRVALGCPELISNYMSKCRKAKSALSKEVDKDALETYEMFLSSVEEFLLGLTDSCDEHSVILHGDCWTNNMLFKYEDENDVSRPTRVCFIDFQLLRLGSPVLDLSYFFYICSSKEIIDELDEYLQIYHNSFSQHLKLLGSDPERLFPYSILKEQWKKYARFGLIFSTLLIYITLTDKSEVVDLSKIKEGEMVAAFDYHIANLPEYNNRIKHIILHFVKNQFI